MWWHLRLGAGAVALLDQPTFGISSLPPLPSSLTGFTVLSVDLVKTYDQIVALMKLASPDGADQVTNFETLAASSSTWTCAGTCSATSARNWPFTHNQPPRNRRQTRLALFRQFVGLTISVQVRDQVAAGKAVDSLVETINTTLKEQRRAAGAKRNAPALQFEKQAGPHSRYEMDFAAAGIAGPVAEMYRPTVIVGQNQLVIGATGGAVDRALTAGRWQPELAAHRRVSRHDATPSQGAHLLECQ